MTASKIEFYQRVALTRELPQHNLRAGSVAVVVEHLPGTPETKGEGGVALEVYNAVGETIAVAIVPMSAVKPPSQDEILKVRTWRSAGEH
jgi:hypothetical protein